MNTLHQLLIKFELKFQLKHYGVRGVANDLLDRQQFVYVSGQPSSSRPISHGVPQGSVLGPLLFLLYINDLPSALSFSKAFLFADDTGLLISDSNLKSIEVKANKDLKLFIILAKSQ